MIGKAKGEALTEDGVTENRLKKNIQDEKRRGAGRMGFSVGSRKRGWKSTTLTIWSLAAEHSQLSLSPIQATTAKPTCSGRNRCPSQWIKVIYSWADHSVYFCLFSMFPKQLPWQAGPWSAYDFFFFNALKYKHLSLC